MNPCKPALLLAGCLLTPSIAAAADPVPLGPLGGSATSVVVHPQNPNELLVIKYTIGLFRSDDAGLTFAPHGTGYGPMIRDLRQDPQSPTDLFVLDGTQILHSTDFGANWSPLGLQSSEALKDLAVSPFGSGAGLIAVDAFNVYRSLDSGANWSVTASLVPFAGEFYEGVAMAPANPAIVYLASSDGVYKSTDGGGTFTDPGPFNEWVQTLTVQPSNPNTVFVGTPFNGVLRSVDGAATFQQAGPVLGNAEFFEWEPNGSRLWHAVLDGLFFSTDLGNTWIDGSTGFPDNTPICLDMAADGTGGWFLGCEGGGLNDQSGGGLYYLPSGTSTWTHLGFLQALINDAQITGPAGKRVIGIGSGVYAGDKGVTPTPTAWHFDIGTDTRAIAISKTDPDRWVTGGVGAFFDNAQIVVITQNGNTFAKTYEKFGAGVVSDIQFDPHVPNRVVAGMFPAGFGNPAIIVSNNAGDSWTEIPSTVGWATRAIAHDPFVPGRVLQLSDNNQWAVSTTGGASWSALQPAWPGSGPAVLLAFDPFVQNVLFRGDEGSGLWRSDNGGASWISLGVGLQSESDLVLHPEMPGLIWVSDSAGKILVSGNRGASWSEVWDVHLDANGAAMAIDTKDGSLLVGTTAAAAWEIPQASPYVKIGAGTQGTGGIVPRLYPKGGMPEVGNAGHGIICDRIRGGSTIQLVFGLGEFDPGIPAFGGKFFVNNILGVIPIAVGGAPGAPGAGSFTVPLAIPNDPNIVGITLVSQYGLPDPGATNGTGVALSDALRTTFQP